MSLRFRKRFKVLPGIYLNLGKNGVSTTIGPRGANINIGKRGVYVNTGFPGTGISNREKLFGGTGNNSNPNLNLSDTIDTIPSNEQEQNLDSTQNVTTSQGLVGLQEHLEEAKKERESIAVELKEAENNFVELQSNLLKKQNGFFSKLFTARETIESLAQEVEETSKELDEFRKQYEESKADININFETGIELQYKKLNSSFNALLKSRTIWDITQETTNTEVKSGAKSIVERKEVKFKLDTLDFIKSEYQAFNLQNANGSNLFIYPAFVLIIDKQNQINLIDLKELNFRFHQQSFQELKETVPSDSKITEYTWYKVNKDGSRDLRYAGNYQIPIVQYGAFNFSSSNSLNETYYISNLDLAINFANEFSLFLNLLSHLRNFPSQNSLNLSLPNLNDNISSHFSREFFDLLFECAIKIDSIGKQLGRDETLIEKVKDSLGETTADVFLPYCLLYDLCQITKILGHGKFKNGSLEISALTLLSTKLLHNSEVDFLNMDYQTVSNSYTNGLYKEMGEKLIGFASNDNPLKIFVTTKNENAIDSTNQLDGELCLPSVLKIIDHPLFDEYSTTLYRFATIIAKADSLVSNKEENILKGIYQIIHNPLPKEKKNLLSISEVDENQSLEEVLNELETLIGLDAVKQEVKSLINYIKVQKEREKVGLKSSQVSYHCVFTGSPGTGKTTIARIIAKIYMHLGILKKGHLVETDRSGLVAEYTGQTAVKVNKTIDSAIDGVLFIDEAYCLVGQNQDDFGKEAVATLMKRMEDDRDKLIIILAGYTIEMKTFIETNPGFKSRFNRHIEFADSNPTELKAIFKLHCSKLDYKLTNDAEKKLNDVLTSAFSARDKSFGNGRYVRNIFEKALEKQANRIAALTTLTKEILTTIIIDDIPSK